LTKETLIKLNRSLNETFDILNYAMTTEPVPEALQGLFQSVLYLIDEWDELTTRKSEGEDDELS